MSRFDTDSPQPARRRFLLKASSTLAAGSLAGLSACGGGDDEAAGAGAAPLSTAEQLALDASGAVAAIRSGRLSAEAYVGTLLARAESLRELNALISIDRDGALGAARRIDQQRAAGQTLAPLAGLPLVVKDNINSAALPTTGGTPALRQLRPTSNAPSLQKLLDAGAILLAKANMHELAFGITSTNLAAFAGPVRNPYDKSRIAGGSSGGTAAAIAARISPAGLGTDTGGSARVPAALCGIVGLRPSVGNGGVQRRYTDTHAVIPISHTRDTVGTMGRSVADVALLDAVIAGREPPAPIGLKGLRIGLPAAFWAELDAPVAAVMAAAKAKLSGAGVVFVEADLPGVAALNAQLSFQIALHEPIDDIPAYLAANGAASLTLAQLAAQIASPDVKGAFGAILGDVYGADYPAAIGTHRPRLQALYADYFVQHGLDAMLFPTTPLAAVAIDAVNGSSTVSLNGGPPLDEFGTYIRHTDAGSNAGIPGLSLPAGLTAAGLPVGLEIDGPLGSDGKLLGIGLAIEALLGRLAAPAA